MTDSSKEEEKTTSIEKTQRLSIEVMGMFQRLQVANLEKFNVEDQNFKDRFQTYKDQHSESERIKIFDDYGLLLSDMEDKPEQYTLSEIKDLEAFLSEALREGNEIREAIEAGKGNLERAARKAFGSKAGSLN